MEVIYCLERSKLIHYHIPATLACEQRHAALSMWRVCPSASYKALIASIQHLAGGQSGLVMSDSSSLAPSPAASINNVKRIEDDVSVDLALESEPSDDLPDAEEDTVVFKLLDQDDEEGFKLRAYQDEMLAESLQRNTIIVLNTGAGKTHM